MKTPHAILIGPSLIAAAIFFKDTMTPPAHAFGGPDGFACGELRSAPPNQAAAATISKHSPFPPPRSQPIAESGGFAEAANHQTALDPTELC